MYGMVNYAPRPGDTANGDPAVLLRARVAEVMVIEQTQWDETGSAFAFTGKLRLNADEAFDKLKSRFGELGFTPALREIDATERQTVLAIKGTARLPLTQRPWLNLLLLLATAVTTTLFGGMYAALLSQQDPTNITAILTHGVPFSLTLLLILGVHELGHYVQARRHGLPVTLPFFIPVPLPGTLGTLGAFIQMRGAVENRRALFDVGIGGPIAGLLVAIPLFVVGLLVAEITNAPAPANRSFLVTAIIALFRPEALNNGIILNAVLLAARFGLVLTAMNLLPIGQLDGGHIAYAAMGRRWARIIGYGTAIIMVVLGVAVSPTWLIWLMFAVFSGFGHAQPLNDITPLDLRRSVVFIATFVLFLSIFTVRPF